MDSNDTNDEIPSTGGNPQYPNSWFEALSTYQRPLLLAKNRSLGKSSNDDSGKGGTVSLREGPMPSMIDGTSIRPMIEIDSNHHSHRRKSNSDSSTRVSQKRTIIDLSNDDNTENVNEGAQYAASNINVKSGVTYYSVSMSKKNDGQKSSFTPFKVEPFEMTPTYASISPSSSHNKLVITVSDSRSVPKKSKKKPKRDPSPENPDDYEPITIDADSPSDPDISVMMKRAIERSKYDMGILKRQETSLNDLDKHDPSNNKKKKSKKNNKSLMPKRVQQLLVSDSDDTDCEERQREVAEYARLAALARSIHNEGNRENPLLISEPIVVDAESPPKSKEKSKSKKRKRAEKLLLQQEQELQEQHQQQEQTQSPSTSTHVITEQEFVDPPHVKNKKIPKLVEDPPVESIVILQCAFIDGLKGRCTKHCAGVYCPKHETVVRNTESEFDTLCGNWSNVNPNYSNDQSSILKDDDSSKKKKSKTKSYNTTTTSDTNILLDYQNKINNLDNKINSFIEMSKHFKERSRNLKKLYRLINNQIKVATEVKQQLTDNMLSMIDSWSSAEHLANDDSHSMSLGSKSVNGEDNTVKKMLSLFEGASSDENSVEDQTASSISSKSRSKTKK